MRLLGAAFAAPLVNTAPPMVHPRKLLSANYAGGKLYVFGGNGFVSGGGPYISATEVFDPATNTWSKAASLPSGRWAHQSVLAPNGKIYVVGGTRAVANPSVPGQGGDTKVVEVFTP